MASLWPSVAVLGEIIVMFIANIIIIIIFVVIVVVFFSIVAVVVAVLISILSSDCSDPRPDSVQVPCWLTKAGRRPLDADEDRWFL